jgi:hypothetical protein
MALTQSLGFNVLAATRTHAYNGSGAGARDLGLRDGWYFSTGCGVHFAFLYFSSFSRVDISLADWFWLELHWLLCTSMGEGEGDGEGERGV